MVWTAYIEDDAYGNAKIMIENDDDPGSLDCFEMVEEDLREDSGLESDYLEAAQAVCDERNANPDMEIERFDNEIDVG